MIVHPVCKSTVAELSSYCWDKDREGNGINRPVDKDNHLMDALRYAMADVPKRPPQEKPHSRGWVSTADGRQVWSYVERVRPDKGVFEREFQEGGWDE